MGGSGNEIPLNVSIKAATSMKALCKIIEPNKGIGFFIKSSESLKFLVTNCFYNNIKLSNNYIEIETYNKRRFKLNINEHYIQFITGPKNLTIIEIKESDGIDGEIQYLDFDNNSNKGYNIYRNKEILLIKYPFQRKAESVKGKIDEIKDYEFEHDISINEESIGCPIILLDEDLNKVQVIGIHKKKDNKRKCNGMFIGEINNEIENYLKKIKEIEKKEIKNVNHIKDNNNYITAEINVDDINNKIRIINSYEEYMRNNYLGEELDNYYKNEDEIKKCEIHINEEIIPFNYVYKFPKKGKFEIKYIFNNNITKTNFMFAECNHLIKINLSTFNTENIVNMNSMFYECNSLTSINLSNVKTKKVTDMACMFAFCCSLTNINLSSFKTKHVLDIGCMFYECNSLTKIDLSNFNTEKVENMSCMFNGCNSLSDINLSNFNTPKLKNMSYMFKECASLPKINLTNFKTENVENMNGLFEECKSLASIDLSNFNTKKVAHMISMFNGCNSLTSIDLSNFDAQKVIDMDCMFYKCNSLRKKNLIKDERILQELGNLLN